MATPPPSPPAEPPTGLVTLVFTDIEGSSDLWQRFGSAFQPILDEHNRLMREAAQRWGGFEVKTVGDAFFLVFASAPSAVRFALDAQLAFHARDWNALLDGLPELRVRMGLHTGEPILARHPSGLVDYFGPAVNRAARVGGAGHGGQVILSELTRELSLPQLPAEVSFLDRGRHRLKGVGEEHLWQLAHPGLRTDFPPLSTLDPERHNLPRAASPYVGREQELERWLELLRRPDTRAVTLLAFGGIGKTRTALQLAELLLDDLEHGVWWVELEEARDAEGALHRIALGLRLALQKDTPIREQVHAYLKERALLLVLDNTEQIEDAGKLVRDLLAAAPRLKVLVTSRRPLEIREERRIELHPLPGADAVTLFVESARSRASDFEITSNNQADVAELCRRLEGVPLAIELAASRIAGMTPREMLERLNQQFRLLQTRSPDLPPRQRALRGAIDWSYDLLGEEDRELFAQLAVFSGGFDMAAAESVCEVFDVFEGVLELRKHSLLRAETDPVSQQTRYSMLLSVRTYAEEKLRELPQGDADLRERHAGHYLRVAESWIRSLPGASSLGPLPRELDNLRVALAWWSQHGPQDLCARLAAAFYHPLYRLGLWPEAQRVLEAGRAAVAALGPEADGTRADLETSTAALLDDLGDYAAAQEHVRRALELRRSNGDPAAAAETLNVSGLILQHLEQPDAAEAAFQEALGLLPADPSRRGKVLHNLAYLEASRGNLQAAAAGFEAALAERRRGEDTRGEAETLAMLGAMHHMLADGGEAERYPEAGRLYCEALPVFRSLGDRYWEAVVLHNLGELACAQSEVKAARDHFTRAERIFRDLNARQAEASREWLERLQG